MEKLPVRSLKEKSLPEEIRERLKQDISSGKIKVAFVSGIDTEKRPYSSKVEAVGKLLEKL